jgi:hypothetical protein
MVQAPGANSIIHFGCNLHVITNKCKLHVGVTGHYKHLDASLIMKSIVGH